MKRATFEMKEVRYGRAWLQASLLFAITWTVGGALDVDSRVKFDTYVRSLLTGIIAHVLPSQYVVYLFISLDLVNLPNVTFMNIDRFYLESQARMICTRSLQVCAAGNAICRLKDRCSTTFTSTNSVANGVSGLKPYEMPQ